MISIPRMGLAGSARDYLNAPIDTWLTFYNFGDFTSVTPEDGLDVTSSVRTNVLSQSVVITRTMDFWGRTGGISAILPYAALDASSDAFRASNQGVSDVGFLWQMNIFGGPALTNRSFIPETFASFHLAVTTPLGQYQPTNPLNPSANRWMFESDDHLQLHARPGLDMARSLSVEQGVHDQCRYHVGGASSLSQNPLFIVEGHASRNLSPALWVTADAYYNIGGETRIDWISQQNAANAKPAGQPDAQAILMTIRQVW